MTYQHREIDILVSHKLIILIIALKAMLVFSLISGCIILRYLCFLQNNLFILGYKNYIQKFDILLTNVSLKRCTFRIHICQFGVGLSNMILTLHFFKYLGHKDRCQYNV